MSIRDYLISNVEGLKEDNFNLVMEQVETDFSGAPKRATESKVTTSEVSGIMDIIEANFSGVEFQNKDLSPLVKDLTARQIPSRLKKLVDAGKLQDLGGSPKKYKLA
jgi:hypothetical protein